MIRIEIIRRAFLLTPWGMARAAAWMLLFLTAASFVLPDIPPRQTADGARFQRMITAYGDPRGFFPPPAASGDHLRVSWIGGSDLMARLPEAKIAYLPALVQQELDATGGPTMDVAFYMVEGGRLFEQYLCVLHALSLRPDALVLSINPIWLNHDHAVAGLRRHDLARGAALHAGWDIRTLGLLAALTSPSELSSSIAADFFPVLRNRLPYRDALAALRARLANRMQPKAVIKVPPVPDNEFWIRHHGPGPTDADSVRRQRAVLLMATDSLDNTINGIVFEEMLRRLVEANIPALLYVAPVPDEAKRDPVIGAKMAAIERGLEIYADRLKDTRVRLIAHSVDASDAVFLDYAHLRLPGGISARLADAVRSLYSEPHK